MAFPNSLLLITFSVSSYFAIGLEFGESLIDYKEVFEETRRRPGSSGISLDIGDEVTETSDLVGIIGGKSKSEAAISAIHKYATLSAKRGASLMAVVAIEAGLKCAVDLVAASSDATDKALASAVEKSCDNPEAATLVIQEGMKTAQELIYSVGLPLAYSFNAARVITGGGSKKWLGLGKDFVQQGGTYAIASLVAAENFSTHGLKSNLVAAAKGLDAAREAAKTGYEAALASLVLAAQSAFKGLSNDVTDPIEKDKRICATRRTPQSAEAKAAKSAIRIYAEQAIQLISQGPITNAIYKIEEGLICGIEAAAAGETSALRAISITTKLALNEPGIAIATFKAGVGALKMAIINAGNETRQGLDEAATILGNQKINKIVSATVKVQNGVASALEDIETAEKLTAIGLQFGGDVEVQGLKAAYKSVTALLFVFYSHLVKICEEVF